MKKWISLFLCLVLTLSLVGCAGSGTKQTSAPATEAPKPSMQIGYGRADITPADSVPLYGYLELRNSLEVLDPLYATCTAYRDATGFTVLTFTLDWVSTFAEPVLWAKVDISKATGIPVKQIMVTSTHMHSGPAANNAADSIQVYKELFRKRMVEAAQAAIADLKEAQVYSTSVRLENMNFVRHYVMDDGSVIGDNFGTSKGKKFVKHVSDADNELQILRYTRPGAKDIVMVNWQTHPHRAGQVHYNSITADIVGSMRSYVEKEMDCHFAYYTGASGNINPKSRIKAENITEGYLDQGQAMGKAAVDACKDMTQMEIANIGFTSTKYFANVEKDGKKSQRELELFVLSIGNVAFAWVPYEMFDTNGVQVKEGSPFDMTFICTMANIGGNGYIPSEATYEYGGYEVEKKGYVKGTAEELVSEFLKLLKDIHPGK